MLRLGLAPLEVTLMLPLATPVVVGANSTLNDVLCPAFKVTGTVMPLRLNPLPLAVAAEMVRVDPPELVSVPESDFELPVCTLPKLKLAGFGESCPWATPVPDNAIVRLASDALEVMLTLPLAAPLAVGANSTLKDVLCPAFSVIGTVRPLRVNPLPLAEAAEMVSAVPPVLVNVSERPLLLPT
jgi:hypothetical protein